MADIKAIADHIQRLTLIEASRLIKLLEERLSDFPSAQAGCPPLAARGVSLNTRPDITYVKAILSDGREIPLVQKHHLGKTGQPSQCTFFGELPELSSSPFEITLRLDWNPKAMDANDDPTLDADICDNGKKYCVDRMKWHHTPKRFENGEWVYNFEFENIKLSFRVGITSQRNIQSTARISPFPASSAKLVDAKDLDRPWAFGEKQVFCAACQAVTTQKFLVDHNNEIVATCHCGRFLKFPLTETEEELAALLAAHHKSNSSKL